MVVAPRGKKGGVAQREVIATIFMASLYFPTTTFAYDTGALKTTALRL